MSALGPPAGGLRLIRWMLVLVGMGVVLNAAGWAYSLKLNADRVNQINAERLRNTRASCEREAGQNRQIMAFLRERHASREAIRDASRFFPVRKPGECALVARRQVSNP